MMDIPHQNIETERLLLRPICADDRSNIVRILNNGDVARWLASVPHPYTDKDSIAFLEFANTSWAEGTEYVFAIVPKDIGEICGVVGLKHLEEGLGEPGYYLDQAQWGKSYVTEAAGAVINWGFQSLGMKRMQARHFAGNEPSARVLQKLGFKYTGDKMTLHSKACGEEVENLWMSLSLADFRA